MPQNHYQRIMNMQLTQAPLKKLELLLRELSPNRSVGFDYKRDPRTNNKAALLNHIIGTWTNEQIIQAWNALERSEATHTDYNITEGIAAAAAAALPTATPQATHNYADNNSNNSNNNSNNNDDAKQLAEILARMASKPTQAPLDSQAVIALIKPFAEEAEKRLREEATALTDAIEALKAPTRVVIENKTHHYTHDAGIQHKAFPTLLKAVSARLPDGHRLNIWLKGPAGSGKTTAAHNAAKALNLPFHFNGAIDTKFELTGFVDASGRYHRTAFRDAFEHGGVYLFDEVDSSNPSAVLAFNSALANGVFTFPDKQVSRHADCCVIAGANTAGNGANSEYVGRFKQDAAFLDRFILIEWELDESLERALATDTVWLDHVQKMRSKVRKREIKNFMITPRATLYGAALLRAGLDRNIVEQLAIRKGLNTDAWESLGGKTANTEEIPF
jgi:hypothetical protein